ncbi:hypothetical protein KAFR_0D02110 [Kazachstania africana CBS 2517]|uniref:Uncharacterized protein n=1 Tax=Kazachstania africana (strain ATCC 22294 / BCRC 22015 / CBS 2517 / CECT 1963 / NBRC 1671 / NRRL Y-8276) TaxID=1071382 RepID=H2AU08_KAZAF|nr:hypothetical protein KAFR_0D02110 [Kazachstania africana CBS 2517]CCF57858.1 hypothetical protein KAFR_0D02110 [Kazachstania africana CBS 2517]
MTEQDSHELPAKSIRGKPGNQSQNNLRIDENDNLTTKKESSKRSTKESNIQRGKPKDKIRKNSSSVRTGSKTNNEEDPELIKRDGRTKNGSSVRRRRRPNKTNTEGKVTSSQTQKEDFKKAPGGGEKKKAKTRTANAQVRNTQYNNFSIDPQANLLMKEREDQINLCIHKLGPSAFKLFRKGRYVTSYGFIPKRSKSTIVQKIGTFLINIPLNYPATPIKLASNRNEDPESIESLEQNQIIKNFNNKARELNTENYSLISQLNYLINEIDRLANKDFLSSDKRKNEFYTSFLTN